MHGFDIIPNENNLYSNLNNDGLHLNEGGGKEISRELDTFC